MSLKATSEYAQVKDLANSQPRGGPSRGKRKPNLAGPPSKKRNIQAKSGLQLPASALENLQDEDNAAEQVATNLIVQEAADDVAGYFFAKPCFLQFIGR